MSEPKKTDFDKTSGSQYQEIALSGTNVLEEVFSISTENFFLLAAEKLANIVEVKYLLITECCNLPASRVRSLAFWADSSPRENITYLLENTPCNEVMEGNEVHYRDGIQQKFPLDQDLVDLDAIGYLGIPIYGEKGNVIGHIAALDTKPIEISNWKVPILRTFANRCSIELDRMQAKHMVDALTAGYHLPNGRDFFQQLTKVIADELDVDFAVIGRFIELPERKIDSLAIYNRGKHLDSMAYSLANSPCETVVGKRSEAYPSGVQEIFPEFSLLKTLDIEGYVGTPLFDSTNKSIGLMAVLNQNPLDHPEKIKSILEIFGIRASLEIERSKNEENIRYYDAIFSTTDDLLSFVDKNYIYRAVNLSYTRKFGIPVDEITGLSVADLHGEEVFFQHIKDNLDESLKGNSVTSEFSRPGPDGQLIYIQGQHNPFYDINGEIVGVVVAARDITILKAIQGELANSKKQLQSLYDDTPSMFFTINNQGVIVSVNAFGAEKLGYEVAQLLGKPFQDLVLDEDKEVVERHLENCFSQPDKVLSWELRKLHRNGEVIWAKESARVVDTQTTEKQLFIVSEDISEKHKLSMELSHQATHDALTQLINRPEFEYQLQNLLDQDGSEHALCYMDLDQFKIINDACGHLAGDELLKGLARLLRLKIRTSDILARLGGDEFGILMKDCAITDATQTASSLLKTVTDFEFIWQGKKYQIGVSIGVVAINSRVGSLNEVMRRVDAACYMAKDYGRNRVHVYREDDVDIERHQGEMNWVGRIREAIDCNNFALYAQKIININEAHGSQSCCELLIRLIENGKLVLPGAFLPAAERFNLSIEIDQWVVSSAIDWLVKEQANQKEPSYCSINLSGISLGSADFLEFVMEKLSESGIPCHVICFEITETAAVANLASAIQFIDTVKSLGCSFSLDDFGSGVSSFGYLKNLPVDYVKIDGAFVKDIHRDPIDYAMVRSINEIAHVMGKKTIAEFVENNEVLEKLKEIGVDYAQGYFIGKPKKLIEPPD